MENHIDIDKVASITYRDDNILLMCMADKSDIDINAAKLITEKSSELAGNKVHANMVDIRKMTFMSNDARKHFASQNKDTVKAVAVISNKSFHRPLVNFYLKFSRPSLPTKIFDDEEKAVDWLKSMLL